MLHDSLPPAIQVVVHNVGILGDQSLEISQPSPVRLERCVKRLKPTTLLARMVHRQNEVPSADLVGQLHSDAIQRASDLFLATGGEGTAGKRLDLIDDGRPERLRRDHVNAAIATAWAHVCCSRSLAQEHDRDHHLDVLTGVSGPFDAWHATILAGGCHTHFRAAPVPRPKRRRSTFAADRSRCADHCVKRDARSTQSRASECPYRRVCGVLALSGGFHSLAERWRAPPSVPSPGSWIG